MARNFKNTLAATLLAIAFLSGCTSLSKTPEPKFTVLQQQGDIELRQYAPKLIATTIIEGERRQAINDGFSILAKYIFGQNSNNADIAMTAPVSQNSAVKIAMTAPVSQQLTQSDGNQTLGSTAWQIEFVMPDNFTAQTLPRPLDARITISSIEPEKRAVIRFAGLASDAVLAAKTTALQNYLHAEKIRAISGPIYAFYDPPWTLPWLRRNEVMFIVE